MTKLNLQTAGNFYTSYTKW